MITNLTPCYSFKDGIGFVVGAHDSVEKDSDVHVYIPSLMSEIVKSDTEEESVEGLISSNQIFLNAGSLSIPSMVTKKNYVTAKASGRFVMEKANDILYKKSSSSSGSDYITHVPTMVSVPGGEKVYITSNIGSVRDLVVE